MGGTVFNSLLQLHVNVFIKRIRTVVCFIIENKNVFVIDS